VGFFFLFFLHGTSIGNGQQGISYNVGDWRSKSLALLLMASTTLDGFYFANCVLAAVFFYLIFSTLENNLEISLK
tara:strand:+ start:639 stop:863 length:225 start_codon:yes stop_codon:yes gene_type:complete